MGAAGGPGLAPPGAALQHRHPRAGRRAAVPRGRAPHDQVRPQRQAAARRRGRGRQERQGRIVRRRHRQPRDRAGRRVRRSPRGRHQPRPDARRPRRPGQGRQGHLHRQRRDGEEHQEAHRLGDRDRLQPRRRALRLRGPQRRAVRLGGRRRRNVLYP